MCCEKERCEKPEKLTDTPQDCSPEQIRECHGDAEDHPCAGESGKNAESG